MTARELRSSVTLASLFALRMFGLFLILPVFAVHARGLPGGQSAALVGLAMGVYGLTQAMLHLPFGIASDRLGRKPVIVAGLVLFALGSFIAAGASSVWGVVIGRAVQGAGAISAAITAFVADSTRESQRTKAMAMVGGSIGVTFAVSLVAAPALYAWIGMSGLFELTGVLALLAILVTLFVVPSAPTEHEAVSPVAASSSQARSRLIDVATEPDLLRLNLGIFVLHCVQMSMFVVVPRWLVERVGLPLAEHWKLYLGVVVASFAIMLWPLMWGERRGHMRVVFLSAVALLAVVAVSFTAQPVGLVPMAGLLLAFFTGFNILEASLPSLVSRIAPPDAKGAALGIYNTMQALGLFTGGALGGWVQSRWGGAAVFAMCAGLLVVWLAAAAGLRRWPAARGARVG
jgi:MFS family permease